MPTQKEFEKAKRLALLHDKVRKDVSNSLSWALDLLDTFKERMPKNMQLAKNYIAARSALRTSIALTEAEQEASLARD
jgi:hypothetical protein